MYRRNRTSIYSFGDYYVTITPHTRFYFLVLTLVTVCVVQVVSFTTVSVSDIEGVVFTVLLELQETANIDAITIAVKIIFFIILINLYTKYTFKI